MIGAVIGLLTDNIGLWIPVGLCIGVAVGASLPKKKGNKENDDENSKK